MLVRIRFINIVLTLNLNIEFGEITSRIGGQIIDTMKTKYMIYKTKFGTLIFFRNGKVVVFGARNIDVLINFLCYVFPEYIEDIERNMRIRNIVIYAEPLFNPKALDNIPDLYTLYRELSKKYICIYEPSYSVNTQCWINGVKVIIYPHYSLVLTGHISIPLYLDIIDTLIDELEKISSQRHV